MPSLQFNNHSCMANFTDSIIWKHSTCTLDILQLCEEFIVVYLGYAISRERGYFSCNNLLFSARDIVSSVFNIIPHSTGILYGAQDLISRAQDIINIHLNYL